MSKTILMENNDAYFIIFDILKAYLTDQIRIIDS